MRESKKTMCQIVFYSYRERERERESLSSVDERVKVAVALLAEVIVVSDKVRKKGNVGAESLKGSWRVSFLSVQRGTHTHTHTQGKTLSALEDL